MSARADSNRETKCHFKASMCKHLVVFASFGKRVKEYKNSDIKESHLFFNHPSGFDNFYVLFSNNNRFKVTLMESV